MTDADLQALVEQISLQYFQRPFTHQAVFNSRLRTSGGRYHLRSHNLDFNKKILEVHGLEAFIGVIKHELCHYHLHLTKGGYRHADADFKALLKAVGGSRFVKPLPQATTYQVYRCQGCGCLVERKRKIQVDRYVCGHCRDRLIYQGAKSYGSG